METEELLWKRIEVDSVNKDWEYLANDMIRLMRRRGFITTKKQQASICEFKDELCKFFATATA